MRRVCFVITSHIHYSRSKSVFKKLQGRRDINLNIVVGGSATLEHYGDVLADMERDGFHCNASVTMTFEGGNRIAMAKTAGIGVSEFANVFENLEPDIVVMRGDRYEVLSAAIAAAYLNIPVAHIEGGDVTGTIDESVRHAVTKLSHIHFPTNRLSAERIIRMGEDPRYVFDVGCPSVEYIANNRFSISKKLVNSFGVGGYVNLDKPYLIVMKHPVTTESAENRRHTELLLEVIHGLNIPTIWFWPNVDAGTDAISKAIRIFREKNHTPHIRFHKYLATDDFFGLLRKTACLVGNSSVGIKESSYWGIPVVNIGSRQNGRLRAENVIDVPFEKRKIREAITHQLEHGNYEPSEIYYKSNTSEFIARTLATVPLYIQKKFHD